MAILPRCIIQVMAVLRRRQQRGFRASRTTGRRQDGMPCHWSGENSASQRVRFSLEIHWPTQMRPMG